MRRLLPFFATLLVVTLACSLPAITPTTGPQPQPDMTEPPATESPTAVTPLPQGFVTFQNNGLVFYNLQGAALGQIAVALGNASPESLHVTGGVSGGSIPPVVYFDYRDTGGCLFVNTNGLETKLLSVPNYVSLLGASGMPWLAYSTAEYTDNNGLRSQLFVGDIQTLPGAAPALTVENNEGNAILPLAMRLEDDGPVGIWYSLRPFCIGGDIVFDPSSSLFYLDLSSENSTTILGGDSHTVNLSPDHTWAGYASGDTGNGALTILNLNSNEKHAIPLLTDSDRGAGDAVFSPDNYYVAWMEGHGWQMADVPDFRATIRVAIADGTPQGDYPASVFDSVAGFPVAWMQPVGWLDNNSILIQVRGMDWQTAALVKLDSTENITIVAPGNFVEFLYP